MVKLLLNMQSATDNDDFTVWIYRRLINDIRLAISTQNSASENFELLGEMLEEQSYHSELNNAEKKFYNREIEAMTNRCLSTMIACLPTERRFAFLLAGVFNVPVPIVSMILETSETNVEADLAIAQRDLETFTKGHCSLFGEQNSCTCDKRVNYFFEQDEAIEFFNDNHNSKRKKISQLIVDGENGQLRVEDDILAVYRNQPFLEPHKASDGVNRLCKKPEFEKDRYFN
jgi:DNA-directed RNA polymerase specialized sigma24 family protein